MLVFLGLFAISDARAQATLDGWKVCALAPKERLEALFGGRELPLVGDFDSNTKVATCERSFALPAGIFFVQLTVFEGGLFAEQPRRNFESDKASGKVVDLPGVGDAAHRPVGPVAGYMFIDALHGEHVVAVLADYDERGTRAGEGSGRPIGEKLQRAVIEAVKETLARWPR